MASSVQEAVSHRSYIARIYAWRLSTPPEDTPGQKVHATPLQGDGTAIDWNKVSFLISLGLQPSFCAPDCTAASVPGSLAGVRVGLPPAPAPGEG